MAAVEIEHKKRLVELADSIRKKYNKFKYGELEHERKMKRKYKPLIKLQEQKNAVSAPSKSTLSSNKQKYQIPSDFEDTIYGIKQTKNGCLMLGKYEVVFENNIIKVNEEIFPITTGLLSLLSKKLPRSYNDLDLQTYKTILEVTGVHLTKTGQLKYQRGQKFREIIKPLFDKSISTPSLQPLPISLISSTPRLVHTPKEALSTLQHLQSTLKYVREKLNTSSATPAPSSLNLQPKHTTTSNSNSNDNDDDNDREMKKKGKRKRRRIPSRSSVRILNYSRTSDNGDIDDIEEEEIRGKGLPSMRGPQMNVIKGSNIRNRYFSRYSVENDFPFKHV